MESDSGSYFNSSMLFKASILTISFTTFYFYKTGKQFKFMPLSAQKTDTATAVIAEKPVLKKKRKTIYLTFDDGPDKGTKTVYNILKEEEIPATLFIVGEHVNGSSTQQNMYDSLKACNYFEIANHSYSHAFNNRFDKFYSEPDSAVLDFERSADSLHFSTNIVRTPGRNIWRTNNIKSTDIKLSETAADSLYSKGFIAVGWDLEWQYNNEQRLVQTDSEMLIMIDSAFAKKQTKTVNHLVLLAHDRTFKTMEDSTSLRNFIMRMKKQEVYDFAVISQYPRLLKDSLQRKPFLYDQSY
ncbi:MAG: polysaccharide deacetylase family protein [Ferruginibacter sp.]